MNNFYIYFAEEFLKNISNVLAQPLAIGLILFFVGKYFWLDKFLISKDLDIKKKIVGKIYLLQEKLETSKFYYDRMINTVKLAQQSSSQNRGEQLKRATKEEIKNISSLINNDIPILLDPGIRSSIRLYFKNPKELCNTFDEYAKELEQVRGFMVSKKWFENKTLKKSDDFSELNLKNLTKKEENFIQELLISDSIFINKKKTL